MDTKIANVLLGLATEAFVAAQLASRDASITALQGAKADTTLLASYATNAALSASETTLQSALDAILAELAALQLSGSGGVVNAPAWARSRRQRRSQPAFRGSSLCCAGQRRRHAEHHGRLLLHGGHERCHNSSLAGLLHLLTSGHSVGRLPHRGSAGRGDDQRHHSRAAGLLHRSASGRAVGRRRARRTRRRRPPSRARCWPTGRARTRTCSQPTKSPPRWWRTARPPTRTRQRPQASPPPCSATTPSRRWTVCWPTNSESRRRPRRCKYSGRRRGRRADPGPHGRLTVKLDGSPQQRLQRGSGHAHRGSERGRLHPDPGSEPVEHCAHLQLDAGPRAPLRLPLPARHGLQLRGVHVRGRQRLRPIVRQLRGRLGLPNQTAGTVDVYGLQILDATLETGDTVEEEDTAASAHKFLDGGADDVTLATLGEVLLEPTLTCAPTVRALWPRPASLWEASSWRATP